jgi:hypothetical protein
MSKSPPRKRTQRREQQRALGKTVASLERLAAQAEGGSRERPIALDSPAIVELRARQTPCLLCAGELEVRDHEAEFFGGEQLRVVSLACRSCHAPRRLWFRIGRLLPS